MQTGNMLTTCCLFARSLAVLRGSVITTLKDSLLLRQIIQMTWFCYCSLPFHSFLYSHFSS